MRPCGEGALQWVLWAVVCVALASSELDDGMKRRPPGTLLLNMLIKNEAEHLERSLPKWAPLIDYWIVGIDSNNTDNSEEVIRKHLGHLPGEMLVVHFDGMGPTWTKTVERGLVAFPNATHGILSDADFTPTTRTLDKMQLDIRCSKHMFLVRSSQNSVRKMDWIYRNIPGAMVERRTHQSLFVPDLPGGHPYQTLIDLEVMEYEGGYQDRSQNKSGRYINWLLKDLEERPGDGRTIYYLGHGHLELWQANPDFNNADSKLHLGRSLEYFKQRTNIRKGYYEERWFAMIKAAEICERYLGDYQCSVSQWKTAQRFDPDRADTFFYISQHYNLAGQPDEALKEIRGGLMLATPRRSLFQWLEVYQCLRYREMARAAANARNPISLEYWKLIKKAGKKHQCPGDEGKEVDAIVAKARDKIKELKAQADSDDKIKQPPPSTQKTEEAIETKQKGKAPLDKAPSGKEEKAGLTGERKTGQSRGKGSIRGHDQDAKLAVRKLSDWSATFMLELTEALADKKTYKSLGDDFSQAINTALEVQDMQERKLTCDAYLGAVQGYLDLFSSSKELLRAALISRGSIATASWFSLVEATLDIWPVCR